MIPTQANGELFNMREQIGRADVVFITLDTLRYDIAQAEWQAGNIPNLARVLPKQGWECCHTPGSFTYAAHQAFFAGFLPTPAKPGVHRRLFAARFAGSETTSEHTWTFDEADLVSGLAAQNYHTMCIGGVGFFNRQTALSCVLPDLFHEQHWNPRFSVIEARSTENQVACALERIAELAPEQHYFLFMNIAAIHQPNYMYCFEQGPDTLESHAAALRYVDQALQPMLDLFKQRPATLLIICSDHGTAYGETGFYGHRCGHEAVWQVPFGACLLEYDTVTSISAGGGCL